MDSSELLANKYCLQKKEFSKKRQIYNNAIKMEKITKIKISSLYKFRHFYNE